MRTMFRLALQYGVNGYIVKGCSGPELLRIIRTVQNCESYITPALAARLLTQRKKPDFRLRHSSQPRRASHIGKTRFYNCFRKG